MSPSNSVWGCPLTRIAYALPLLLAVFSATDAFARNVDERLAISSVNVDQLRQRSEAIDDQVQPGRSFITNAQAVQRFQDMVYLHMVGDHEVAAEGFFALVTTAALSDAGLHRDAEWYLAEALFSMGNHGTAEARFQVIAEDDAHPFRADAVRRLLELYAATGNKEKFDDYYQREIVRGRVEASDVINYTVAKSFHQQGDFVKAKSYLLEVGQGSPLYRKARYYLGTIMVQEGELDAAMDYFVAVSTLSVDTLEDRQILDLALLAIARLYYEKGDFKSAAEFYGRVGGDSQYLADKLYEIVWTFIKEDQFQEALRAVEIFLLAFPRHEYTAQLKLLEGHLHLQEVQYDSALSSYEQVIIDYTPIRERFAQLATSEVEGREYFDRLVAGDFKDEVDLPEYVDAMMMADSDLAQAIFVYRELEGQRRSIQASEGLIAELSAVLNTATGLGGFDIIRYNAHLVKSAVVDEQIDLLALEQEWLVDHASGDLKRQANALGKKRDALIQKVAQAKSEVDAARERLVDHDNEMRRARKEATRLSQLVQQLEQDLAALDETLKDEELDATQREELEQDRMTLEVNLDQSRTELAAASEDGARAAIVDAVSRADAALYDEQGLNELRAEYRRFRPEPDNGAYGAAFDELHERLGEARRVVDSAVSKLTTMEGSELERIKARFEHEVQEVASQRVEHARTLIEAEDVSVGLTKAGFGRLEDFFAESVLKADMGIVDVYWSQKLEVADQKERVKEEKQQLLQDLNQRFRVIKQKLRQ